MKRLVLLALLTVVALGAVWLLPPIQQSQSYHNFAHRTEYLGIANFWNVISDVAFLFVAAAAWPRLNSQMLHEPWKRTCFRVLLLGIALTAFGSAYYHWQPTDARLLWDRLPMTIVFMCVLTLTIGEQVNPHLATALLWPLLVIGALSVFYWRFTGDLRPYIVVQFYPLIVVPLMLCFPKHTAPTSLGAQWGMIACYGFAKAAEMFDSRLLQVVPGGAHAWKHIFAALGLLIYTQAVGGKEKLKPLKLA
jgi:hypothetical protein